MRALLILALNIGALLAVSGPASARPRDEVMGGAYRCAAIAPTRLWLDCYYGAAQSQRAALGLAPAPAAQVQLSLSPPPGGDRQNQNVRDEVMASAGRCGSLSDEHQWLNCYYAAAVPVRALLGLSVPAAAAQPVLPAESMPAAPSRHGRRGMLDDLLGVPDINIVSPMESYSFNSNANFIVTLANGQVWRQLEGDSSTAHWRKPASTYLVNITGGALGSFNLMVKGNPVKFKVKRVS